MGAGFPAPFFSSKNSAPRQGVGLISLHRGLNYFPKITVLEKCELAAM
jgi:hypothetical protein